jgi:hypothetical protein
MSYRYSSKIPKAQRVRLGCKPQNPLNLINRHIPDLKCRTRSCAHLVDSVEEAEISSRGRFYGDLVA